MKLNIAKIREDINALSIILKEQKKLFTESGQPRVTYINYLDRIGYRKNVTLLCSLRASHRGKIHIRGITLEQQEAMVAKVRGQYLIEETQAA